ncbi:hypothetical protein GCM10010234_09920 [Streptomyces hawaiiensis]|uniref:hypothetical protein n=1 Tax=Streptomyces hawaiiensis TaxID=67305 RepID=UPI0031D99A98
MNDCGRRAGHRDAAGQQAHDHKIMYRLGYRTPPPPGGPPTAAGARLLDHRRRHPGQHKEHGLPLSGIICDFFRWPEPVDWRFEESEWPDLAAMAEQFADLEVKLAVSMWQTVEPGSDTYHELRVSGPAAARLFSARACRGRLSGAVIVLISFEASTLRSPVRARRHRQSGP